MWAKPGRLGEVRWLRVVAEISRAGRAAPHPAYGPWLEDAPFGLLGARIFNVAASRRCDRRPREVGESGALGACLRCRASRSWSAVQKGVDFWSGLGRHASPRRRIRWNVALHVRSLSVSSLFINGGQGGIRTLGTLSCTHAFQACPFDRSGTCPKLMTSSKGARIMVATVGCRKRNVELLKVTG